MSFNKFISQSKKFLCLGLSLITASSITLSATKSQASELNNRVNLVAQASSSSGSAVTWQNIVGGIVGGYFGLDGNVVSQVYGRGNNLYAINNVGNIY